MSHTLFSRLFLAVAAVFFCFILWVIYLANTGAQSLLFDLVHHIPYGDKLGHMLLFGLLTFVANLALQSRHFLLGRIPLYYGAVLVSIFVLSEEICQGFIPSRTLDIIDLVADAVGIILFSYLSGLTQRILDKKRGVTT
ncbi:VanZ family protein [Shewanella phaeophyticola]|uniref:VanZ family protein n=1 Tax=Shewanella phaeophyticola TaxID=2978345 RepID=A0ABT2P2V5_9GAMM|nr:VanZ family protein [Shewanella sp. KJ10-1]MCT8985586.1 VanZ family protein [Shewanella sp. KJ10-1]